VTKPSHSEYESRLQVLRSTTGLVPHVLERASVEKGEGRDFWYCPYKPERTASFHVVDNGRKFCCFGCGEKGDAIDLVQHLWRVNFGTALHMLWKGLKHKSWSEAQVQRELARKRKTEEEHGRALCSRLKYIAYTNGALLRRRKSQGEPAGVDIENALEWVDHYDDRIQDTDGAPPPGAYLGLVRACRVLSRSMWWALPIIRRLRRGHSVRSQSSATTEPPDILDAF